MTSTASSRVLQAVSVALCLQVLTSCKKRSSQKPAVLAFTVIQHTVIDMTKGEDSFLDTLSKYFGTTRSEGKMVIAYTDEHNNRNTVGINASMEIEKSLLDLEKSNQTGSRDEFILNVMSPFLQCVLHNNPLPPEAYFKIYNWYAKEFQINNAPNGLSAVATSIKSYREGGSFHADSLNLLNQQIMPYGKIFQLNNRYKQACLLDVTDTILAPRKWKDSTISVIETGRNIPCFLGIEFGYSSMNTNYVIVVKDKIHQQAEEYFVQLDTSWHGTFYPDRRLAERIWWRLGLGMTRLDADKIRSSLLKHDFEHRDLDSIAKELEIETAIHEAKHITDYIDRPTMLLNFDCEVSAHLTEAICSNTPFHGLVDAIQRIEGFYANSGNPLMAKTLIQLWKIASVASDSAYSKDTLREKLREVYSSFIAESTNAPLPTLDEFNNTIVPDIKDGVSRAMKSREK